MRHRLGLYLVLAMIAAVAMAYFVHIYSVIQQLP